MDGSFRAAAAMLLAALVAATRAHAVSVAFERLGVLNSNIGFGFLVPPSDAVPYDCSSGTCIIGQCSSDTTICVLDGLRPGDELQVFATAKPCDCPISPICQPGGCGNASCADGDLVRFRSFSGYVMGKGTFSPSYNACLVPFTVPSQDAVIGACWQCGPNIDTDGTSCNDVCSLLPVPPLAGGTTTTTLAPGGTPPLSPTDKIQALEWARDAFDDALYECVDLALQTLVITRGNPEPVSFV